MTTTTETITLTMLLRTKMTTTMMTTRTTMKASTKTTKTTMNNNAMICSYNYYDQMRCTWSESMLIPWCEPIK
jgi:hypothetical protein